MCFQTEMNRYLLGPVAAPVEGLVPVGAALVAVGERARGERGLLAPGRRASAGDAHTPSARPARYAAPSAVVSWFAGRRTGTPSRSAWNWQQQVHHRRAAVDAQLGDGACRSRAAIASTTSAVWNAIASTTARARCARVVPRVMPTIVPRAYGSHHGEPRPVNAGTTYTPPVSATDCRERSDLGRVGDDAEPVAQPLDRGAGDEDRALQRVGRPRRRPSDHATVVSRPSTGSGSVGADVHEHERAGAVGVLGHARLEARLAEQRGLLVAGDAADRDARGPRRASGRSRRSGRSTAAPRAGTRAGTPNSVAQLVATSAARRCRRASCGSRSTDRSRARRRRPPVSFQSSQVSTVPNARSSSAVDAALVQQPRELRAPRSTGRARARCARGSSARGRRRAARRSGPRCGGPATRSRGARGCPVRAVPHHDGLALVGDADRGDRLARVAARADDLGERLDGHRARSRRRRARPSPGCGKCCGNSRYGEARGSAVVVDGERRARRWCPRRSRRRSSSRVGARSSAVRGRRPSSGRRRRAARPVERGRELAAGVAAAGGRRRPRSRARARVARRAAGDAGAPVEAQPIVRRVVAAASRRSAP